MKSQIHFPGPTTTALRRLRFARVLLWLAIPLMAVAQCLPWENLDVHILEPFNLGQAVARYSQIPHSYLLRRPGDFHLFPSYYGNSLKIHLNTSQLFPDGIPERISVQHLADLRDYGIAVLHNRRTPHARPFDWPALEIIAWPLVFIALFILPFLATALSRARPLLWLARFFACSMLVWMIRNLILASGYPDAHLGNVGSGYWLSMATVTLVITGLFLLPHPGKKHHLRHPS